MKNDEIEIGINAGKIWNYLNENGATDVIKMKIDLNFSNTALFLALGWLAREDKIIIVKEKNEIRVKLK